MRRNVKIGLVAAGAAVLAGALSFGPVVRAKASAQAERRGLELEIGAVRPGLGRVWLKDVTVRIPEVPAVEVRLGAVMVSVGPTLAVRRVVAHGGTVRVVGALSEVERQLRAWRERRSPASGGGSGAVVYAAEGLNVVWREAGADAAPQHVWGARYERAADGSERVGADRVRLALRGATLELENARAGFRRVEGQRRIERIAADAVAAAIDLDALGMISSGSQRPAAEKSTQPVAASAGARPTPGAAALTRRLNGWIPLDADRGPKLRARFRHAAQLMAAALPRDGELDLSGVRLRVNRGKQGLGVGPARLQLTRGADEIALRFSPGRTEPGKTALQLSLDLPIAEGPVRLAVDGGPVTLAALGVHAGDLGLRAVDKAEVELSGKAQLSADGRSLAWQGGGKLRGVSIEQRWLAPGPVTDLSVAWQGKGELSLDGSRFDLHSGELQMGDVRVELAGLVERSASETRANLRGGIPLASCQAMLDSTPRGLAPLLDGMRMSGTFSVSGRLELDTRNLDRMVVDWSAANECRITAAPANVSPQRFSQPWRRSVKDANGRVVSLESGPGTPGWVSRFAVSRHMDTAVLICEDGAFFRHRGFDQEAIRNSIRENLKAGRFLRGASTISMQLAKNLYLSRDKTLSRKLQEAVLTMLLEQELTKDQILELYLNVIEFGPGLYGIGPAARHYFNASASQLSLGQSLYLASILPNPTRQYFGAGGQVTPGWSAYLRKLMQIALKIRRITEDELADALEEQVTFGVPYSPRTPAEAEATASAGRTEDEAVFGPLAPGGFDGN